MIRKKSILISPDFAEITFIKTRQGIATNQHKCLIHHDVKNQKIVIPLPTERLLIPF